MRALRILRSASEDIASAVRHYDARDPELGDAFLEGLNDTLERVRALPKSFATWPADPRFRGAPTKRFEAESFEAKRTQSAELNDSAKLSGRA
jgi:hypothetical protein